MLRRFVTFKTIKISIFNLLKCEEAERKKDEREATKYNTTI